MSELTQVFVIAAAVVYLASQLSTFINRMRMRTLKQRLDAINNLHDEVENEIKPSFELWWEDGPSRQVREAALQKLAMQLPVGIPSDMVEQMVAPLLPHVLGGVQEMALHLAIHARMGDQDQRLIAKLPKVGHMRDDVTKHHDEHEQYIDRLRADVLDHGINPAELEAHFVEAA